MKYLVEPTKYLGINISRDIGEKKMNLNQREFIHKFTIGKRKRAPSPMMRQEGEFELGGREVTFSREYFFN